MYIVIEGQDGTGKSTQVRLLAEYFEKQGKNVVIMDEPDGDLPQAHDLHDLILVKGKEYHLEPMSNVLLFTTSRLELWKKIAEPALRAGSIVISARNWWSTLAYQGYGEGISRSKIIRLTKEILPANYVTPNIGIVLTAPDEVRASRFNTRGKATETFEAKPNDFQQRVNHAYPKIAKEFNLITIDATPSIEEVQARIQEIVKTNAR